MRTKKIDCLSLRIESERLGRLRGIARDSGIPLSSLVRSLIDCLLGERDFEGLKKSLSLIRRVGLSQADIDRIAQCLRGEANEERGAKNREENMGGKIVDREKFVEAVSEKILEKRRRLERRPQIRTEAREIRERLRVAERLLQNLQDPGFRPSRNQVAAYFGKGFRWE